MKQNIIKNGIFTVALASAMSFTACTGDLDVTPIDPNLDTPENVLTSTETYNQLLAKCYSALSVSSPDGDSGSPDIKSIDGGFGQYLRALINLEELPTDEVVMNWNDQTIKDLHGLCWSTNDVFVTAAYGRMYYQISLCNEVIRRIDAAGINDAAMQQYRAEARALRALTYYHIIDLFGNVPFVDENSQVGGANPSQISRADLFDWMVNELEETAEQLPANPEKYRAGKGLAYMLLAKLYLNAKVYTGTANYAKCAEYCQKIIDLGYTLASQSDYYKLFCADNDQQLGVGHEIIFSVYQDHLNTKAYGGTTYLINAACGGQADYATDFGLGGSGWAGFRLTPEFVNKFQAEDLRGGSLFYETTAGKGKTITDMTDFLEGGYSYKKFTNLKADGSILADANSFPDTDFPMFRLGDVYLMLAECQVVGGIQCDGIARFNDIRERAGVAKIDNPTRANILDERARELAWECHRRTDLVRFGLLTSGDYLWSHKGMNSNVGTPHGVDAKYNLYPLASSDVISNPNLKQNTGY